VLLLTGQPSLEIAVDALRLGVRDFLVKPVRPSELIASVERSIAQAAADRQADGRFSPAVEKLERQADELVGRLRQLAYSGDDAGGQRSLLVLDAIEGLRRLRERFSGHRLDAVAWDLLLELLRAERMRQKLSVSGLAISVSGVSVTTALRRINDLTAAGYVVRLPDPADARRDFVSLTPESHALLADYLARANALVSALGVPQGGTGTAGN
jgi:DNA-binding MarR family transcriptional regulator